MRAFIYKVENGSDKLGSNTSIITKEYKSLKTLIKHSLKQKTGKYHIEAFYNWTNRYKQADIDIIVEV